jgi:deazaflavin-dependent oxidoreductase (nitroreductase family)
MPEKVGNTKPPRGLSRYLWRAPIWLYRCKLGWVMGRRFLLLNHIGRKSGERRQAVVEVVHYESQTGVYMIASGFGDKSDWYQNLLKTPYVKIQVGKNEMDVIAIPLPPEQSGQAMMDYAHRNPSAAKALMRICGFRVDGSDEDYFIVGRDYIPFLELKRVSH